MMLLLAIAAFASPPSVVVQDDGTVVGRVDLAVPLDVIKARMADPLWLPTVDGGGTVVVVEGKDGDCQLIKSTSPSSVMTVEYSTRRCTTSTGFRSTLRESNAFRSYETRWDFSASEAGSSAQYTIKADSSLWVPESIVRRQTRLGIERMLTNLQAWAASEGS